MKKLWLVFLIATVPVVAAPPTDFDARVEALRRSIGVPGMAIAIVEEGKTTLARGYGVRKLGAATTVDADTLFPIGSTSKAMTVAALATLVDAGKISWDDKVVDRLPEFQMYDPWVTREITIRDLLVHRSGLGLGAGDLLFVPRSNLSRAESVRRLRFLMPKTSFRSTYAYSGSLNMTVHELSTCHRYGIGVKVVVINNQWLGMVRQWQDMVYRGNRSCSDLSDPFAVTSSENTSCPVYATSATVSAGASGLRA